MAAGFLVKQILKHGAKKGTKKAKDFLNSNPIKASEIMISKMKSLL